VFANGWVAGLLCLGIAALYALCFRPPAGTDGCQSDDHEDRALGTHPAGGGDLHPSGGTAFESGPSDSAVAVGDARARRLTLTRMYIALYMNRDLGAALIHQAAHDALTGLPNRTLLGRRIEHELATLDADARVVTLMMLDLDSFQGGQRHLRPPAPVTQCWFRSLSALSAAFETAMRVARLGGDEFAVLLSAPPG